MPVASIGHPTMPAAENDDLVGRSLAAEIGSRALLVIVRCAMVGFPRSLRTRPFKGGLRALPDAETSPRARLPPYAPDSARRFAAPPSTRPHPARAPARRAAGRATDEFELVREPQDARQSGITVANACCCAPTSDPMKRELSPRCGALGFLSGVKGKSSNAAIGAPSLAAWAWPRSFRGLPRGLKELGLAEGKIRARRLLRERGSEGDGGGGACFEPSRYDSSIPRQHGTVARSGAKAGADRLLARALTRLRWG